MRIFILFLCFTCVLTSQEIQTGVVVPSIAIDQDTDQTYAIYLPNSYSEQNQYPLLVFFDPNGQGAQAIQRFTIGASLNDVIIAAPNFTFSDSLNVGLKQSAKFINDIFDSYPVDVNKIILSGKDKGSVLASTSAHLSDNVYGVIAINNGYLDENILKKKKRVNFVFLNHDIGQNYYLLRSFGNLYSFRESLKGYYEFSAKDQWPDAGYLAAAVTDLLFPKDTETEKIQELFDSELSFGNLLYKKRRTIEAYDYVNGLKKQYKKLVDFEHQKELLKKIRNSRTYKIMRLNRNEAAYEEQLLIGDFAFFLEEDSKNAFFDNLGWWNFQMGELDAKIDSSAISVQERKSALRMKSFVEGKVEAKYNSLKENNASIEKQLFINILRTLVNPSNQEAFINAISLSAKDGDSNAALFYLEELMRTGYSNFDSLYTIEGTTALKIGKEWNEIVKAYLGKSKYYDN